MKRREFLRLVGLSFAAGATAQVAGELMTSGSASSATATGTATNFAEMKKLYEELIAQSLEEHRHILEQSLFQQVMDPLTFLRMDYATVSPMEKAMGVHEDPRYRWNTHGLSITHTRAAFDEKV